MGDAQAAGAEARCKKEPPEAIGYFFPGFEQSHVFFFFQGRLLPFPSCLREMTFPYEGIYNLLTISCRSDMLLVIKFRY
jgi:hypothetical protein